MWPQIHVQYMGFRTRIIYLAKLHLKKENTLFLRFVFHSCFWRQDKLYCNHTTLPLQFGCSVKKSLEIDCYWQCNVMHPSWGMSFNIRWIEMLVKEICQAKMDNSLSKILVITVIHAWIFQSLSCHLQFVLSLKRTLFQVEIYNVSALL